MGTKRSKKGLIALISVVVIAALALSAWYLSPIEFQAQPEDPALECTQFGAGVQPREYPEQKTSDGRVPFGEGVDFLGTEDKTPFIEKVVETRVDEFGPYSVIGIEYPSRDGVEIIGLLDEEVGPVIEIITDFVMLHVLDGIHIENPKYISEWLETYGEEFFTESLLQQATSKKSKVSLLDVYGNQIVDSHPVQGNFETGEKSFIPYLRDGGPRLFNKKIFLNQLRRTRGDEGRVRTSFSASGIGVLDQAGYRDAEFGWTGGHAWHLEDPTPNRFFYRTVTISMSLALEKNPNDEWRFSEIGVVPFGGVSYWPMPEQLRIWRDELRVCQ